MPNFFVVGTAKAGTTSLYRYLRQHPQIYMSPVKEPSYFAEEIRPEYLSPAFARHVRRQPQKWPIRGWEEYQELFQPVENERAIGEATPSYLWSRTAARNIHSRIADARIVMILRDPAERAFSQYLHHLAEGFTRLTFRQQIDQCLLTPLRQLSVFHPFLEFGLYSEQVRRYLDLFPRERVRIYIYEEAWRDTFVFLRDLFRFLEVDEDFRPDTSHRALDQRMPRVVSARYFLTESDIWPRLKPYVPEAIKPALRRLAFRKGRATMNPPDRRYLVDYYRADIGKLGTLLGRDFKAWLA